MAEPIQKLSPAQFLAQLKSESPTSAPDDDVVDPLNDVDFSDLGDPDDDFDDAAGDDGEELNGHDLLAGLDLGEFASPDVFAGDTGDEDVDGEERLTELFDRVNVLLGDGGIDPEEMYRPRSPESLEDAKLTFEEVERLVLKFLLNKGSASGRQICAQIKLPFHIVDPILKQMKQDQLVAFRGAAEMGDYVYVIAEPGRERARRYMEECSYFGAAPVDLTDYLQAMEAQSVARQEASVEELREAFSDLIMNTKMLTKLGPAINSGRGMFLYGEPGNGKTSIAERITRCFGSTIWIPRALGIDGDVIRVFDPGVHDEIERPQQDGLFDTSGVDARWVEIVRPTVIAGGELTMDELEVCQNPSTKICEAPLQLKSNCGTLVIDDFGRQTMPVDVLLNRWIVPLEKRYDFLNLPSGKKIQVPFDQLIIFSTNLEPRDLVDGAFLRRIPYKIEVPDPSLDEFHQLFELMCPIYGFEYDRECIDYLIATHYEPHERPFRACQPRDLLQQVKNFCTYHGDTRKLSNDALDFAVENYFSVM